MKSSDRFIKFIGGRDLLFSLILIILIGITIFIFNQVKFIFDPLIIVLSTVVPPIILAFVTYYLLNPIVDLLERLHIKRIWGILILILGISGLITGLVLLIAPAVEAQVKDLTENFPTYIKQMSEGLQTWVQNSFLAPYYDQGYTWLTTHLNDITSKIGDYLGGAVEGIRSVASALTSIVVAIITFPFILFFLLKDGDEFKRYCLKLLPPKYRKDADQILHNMDVQVGSYIQGQIIVALCIGTLLFIGYLIIGLDYAITLAIIAAVTSVVPYLGPIIAITPAIIIALVASPIMLLKLGIVWAAVQFLEGNFISPNIMGRTLSIHPLTIIIVLLSAGNLFGITGVILGIPGYAIIKVITVYIFGKFKARYNCFYGEEYGYYEKK
ncbi:AI-2E family transporter [Virgibacillus siamensis]|uniref:AI-2E family transporter n=1 Tax=Virgibacillus siamensis TaxID=480071 RepID=UPI0009840A93|nr:AI-2E family transporter [Virgibacillus siamensis]